MSDDTANVQPGSSNDLSRRALIKRAAIVGGVVAWTAPTIQVLGQGTAWAKAKKIPPGTVVVGCDKNQQKPNRFGYEWQGGGTCGTGATDDVTIVMTGTTVVLGSVDGGTYINSTRVSGPPGMSFEVVKNDNNQVFTIYSGFNSTTTQCDGPWTFHVSCSQTPPVQPGYKQGGLLLFDWGYVA